MAGRLVEVLLGTQENRKEAVCFKWSRERKEAGGGVTNEKQLGLVKSPGPTSVSQI